MTAPDLILLLLSIFLSAGRNLMSKSISDAPFGERRFFCFQSVIFLSGAAVLALLGGKELLRLAPLTVIYALIYGALLLSAQWCYTVALRRGSTGVCATVYSLGFILPTVSGMLFWGERMTLLKLLGILVVIPAVLLSGMGKRDDRTEGGGRIGSILPLVLAMLASGGLGIMQKVQQASPYPEQKTAFVLIAFVLAGGVSLLGALFAPADGMCIRRTKVAFAAGVGVCFGCCNLLNTVLAGRLESAVFFPSLNVGMILLSTCLGMLLFKERLTKRTVAILLLGIAAILLINLSPT